MNISIIFSTFKSENILEKSLKAYCDIVTDYQWELIVIDNACRKETQQLVEEYSKKLPIVFLEQPKQGKNNALNIALPVAKSSLMLFTDNDTLPNSDIIDVCVEAANEYPEIKIFSGRIIADCEPPNWIDISEPIIRAALGIYNKGSENKKILPEEVWGGNMLLKKEVFTNGLCFNVNVGPSDKSYIMGSETELLKRLQSNGLKAMYIAKNKVYHQIRKEQFSLEWLNQRASRAGRGAAYINQDNAIKLFGIPRYLLKKLIVDYVIYLKALVFHNNRVKCLTGMAYYTTRGKVHQARQKN